jgi:hypothetical protein
VAIGIGRGQESDARVFRGRVDPQILVRAATRHVDDRVVEHAEAG